MKKIWIIMRREYLVRVRSRAFLISTLVVPLLFGLIIFVSVLAATSTENEAYTVWVIDESGKVLPSLAAQTDIAYKHATLPLELLKKQVQTKKNEGILILPEDVYREQLTSTFYSPKSLSINTESSIKSGVRDAVHKLKLINAGITQDKLASTEVKLSLNTVKLTADGEKKTSTLLAAGVGYIMALLIYIMIIVYGQFVMMGVIEEKVNRIAEVMISSLKPIQLMMGKILGIGLVGFTQFFLWIVLIFTVTLIAGSAIGLSGMGSHVATTAAVPQTEEQQKMGAEIILAIQNLNVGLPIYFLLYFIGGFFLYGSLFAAIGASVEQQSDAQQLTIFVMFPLILTMLFIGPILQNPNGELAFWFSLVPFSSPIVMMMRLGSVDVPPLEWISSLLLLYGSVLGIGWVAARIYRVGILLYGTKPSALQLVKWIFVKG